MDALAILNSLKTRALEREKKREERREFFKVAGGFAAGAAGTLALTACGGGQTSSAGASTTTPPPSGGPTDADILNFALNLEYLEANFYAYAASGAGIPASLQTGTGTQGAIIPGMKANLTSPAVIAYANEIAYDELQHVEYLRAALGSAAVAQPAIDVSASPTGSFSTAAQAAGLVPAGTAFNPYANDEAFLLGAYIFEDVGVTAYAGAAPLISSKAYLEAAASILAVEAYHAGLIRTALYMMGLQTPAPAINPFTATADISALRSKLSGVDDDHGIQGPSKTQSRIVDSDPDALVYHRTTGQVLNVVYGNPGVVTKGLFFPDGVNGTINTSG